MRRSYNIATDAAIVKLGGSLAYNSHLRDWLAVCRGSRPPVIIVPGGGPFADAVRDAQARIGLDDKTAHRMALLAMAQYAEVLCSLEPGFILASGHDALLEGLEGPATPIWSPLDLLVGAPGIEESWDVTSDSLAAWLAQDLGIKTLVLVKQAPPPAVMPPLAEMVAEGFVDPAFPGFVEDTGMRVIWLGSSDSGLLHRVLRPEQTVAPSAIFRSRTEPVP